jgi:hypothetical protein
LREFLLQQKALFQHSRKRAFSHLQVFVILLGGRLARKQTLSRPLENSQY